MQALIIIDAQNEFSATGRRPVPDFTQAITAIAAHVDQARRENIPIAWVRHFNKPHESPAFIPGSWGADFYAGGGPEPGRQLEKEFQKQVYGAFTGSDLGVWLQQLDIDEVLITGFYTHGCVSTTAREAIMRELKVRLDPAATGACDMDHADLGSLSAAEVRRSALLQLANMGAVIIS